MWSNFALLDHGQNFPNFQHVLDVFSKADGRIELIPFALSQASCDTSLDYPQRVFWRQIFFNYSAPIPLLWEPEKNDFSEKTTFLIDLIV